MAIKRPDIFTMVDNLYDYHFEKASGLYTKGMSIMIEGTIKKLACIAAIDIVINKSYQSNQTQKKQYIMLKDILMI